MAVNLKKTRDNYKKKSAVENIKLTCQYKQDIFCYIIKLKKKKFIKESTQTLNVTFYQNKNWLERKQETYK